MHAAKTMKKLLFSLLFIFAGVCGFCAETLYWENPLAITSVDSRFPVTLKKGENSYIFWEEVDVKKKEIYLSLRNYKNLNEYEENRRFAGPFAYSGTEVPDIFSVAALEDGTVAVAVTADFAQISVYTSTDNCKSFEKVNIQSSSMMIAPRIYGTKNSGFRIFTSVGEENSFTIFTAESKDGIKWTPITQFQPAATYRNPFIPVLIPVDKSFSANGAEDIVVFQSQYTSAETNRISYQLYMTIFDGKSWTSPKLITDRNSLTAKTRKEFHRYQNQRPFLYNFKNEIYLSWERTDTTNSEIWLSRITENGMVKDSIETIASASASNRGIIFDYQDSLYVTWFDTRRGRESTYMSKRNGSYWEEYGLVENKNVNMFSYPLVTKDKDGNNVLGFVWQQIISNTKNSIAILAPDKSVNPPSFVPLSYKKGRRSRQENVQIQINFPEDSSNISGYSYTWTKDEPGAPPKQIQFFTRDNKIKVKAQEDGTYYLTARVSDYAGNWSEPSSISYYLDLTPPEIPEINFDNLDEYGFINSNNFRLKWDKSNSEDVAGYSYRIDYIGDIPKSIAVSKKHPMKLPFEKVIEIKESLETKYSEALTRKRKNSDKVQTVNTSTQRYYNRSNGVYLLSVCAIDEVGNVSENNSKLFILNKFQPSTYITNIQQSKSETGDTIITINGGGFTYDGTISEIYIDADGKAPYDLVLKKDEKQFKVQSNTRISNVNAGVDLDEGSYRIGLLHTDRGLYFTGKILKIDQNGTLKIEADYVPESKLNANFREYKYKLAINLVVIFVILMLIAVIIIFVLTITVQNIYEKKITSGEIKSILSGAVMPLSKKKEGNNHLPSLKRKLIRFTYSLIVIVVLVVTLENGYKVIRLQEQTMAAGLENRTEVLLESLHSGVKNFFPSNNILELTALPGQKDAMSEVKYVTIIGQKMDVKSSENLNYVWATNDRDILSKTDSMNLTYGDSEIKDETITKITSGLAGLDKQISDDVKTLSDNIYDLEQQARRLYSSAIADDVTEADRLSDVIVDLRNTMDVKLAEYSKNAAGSYPYFDSENLNRSTTDYIFYRPVMYRSENTGNYIHGVVYLELSTQSLIDSLDKEIRKIVLFSVMVAVGAVLFGIFGSVIFASLIIKPIKKLEAHVIMIGQTKNKANLKGKDVEIKVKDEVGRLGDAINNMTHDLVANAEEEALAMDGKAVQKAFLPLVDSGMNNKNTYAEYLDDKIQCYGYYEGESGVSGDYFDYKKLDNEWYGIIKCDASGHGIPAAIIMTVVATIFRRYFENWSFKKNGTQLNVLVEQINDFIEGLGLKGKFATLIICLLNSKTGELYMCNAGDNLVHIYEADTRKMKLLTLSSAPTAGVFTSDLVSMRGGFAVEKTILHHGDVLFLYTDGIEESTRRLREFDYSVRQNQVEVKRMNPKTHEEETEIKLEDAKEEFGPERVQEIIEAVYNRKSYILSKIDNPKADETLEFDFTKCEGTVSEAVMALASLEKVFRLYKSPSVQTTDYIKIDKKIDEFLSKYFNMYEFYAAKKSENTENGINYIDYDEMQEDEQSDDLTLLAIKRL